MPTLFRWLKLSYYIHTIYKGVGIMRLLFIGIQNFLSGCGLMALLILWGLFRRLKEIEKENSQR